MSRKKVTKTNKKMAEKKCGHMKRDRWNIEKVKSYAEYFKYAVISDEYVGHDVKLDFICPRTHRVSITWDNFCQGRRCAECSGRKKLTLEHAREEFDKAGLALLEENYINSSKGMKARCYTAGHVVYPHLSTIKRGGGCEKCSGKAKLSDKEIRRRVKEKHGSRIKFLHRVDSDSIDSHARFACICEHEWTTNLGNVINSSTGCPNCARNIALSKRIVNKRLKDNGRSVKMLGEYVNARTSSLFRCLICDWEWRVCPDNVLRVSDCPECAVSGFKSNKSAIMYYIKVEYRQKTYYKIGITNFTVEKRFAGKDLKKITILKIWKYKKGSVALKKEQGVLKRYRKYRYKGNVKIFKKGGNTELFTRDVLELDR